ncbi:MAG: DUF4340 domain-containing protein [Lachnospiraceae bacterium]|nr:DUF4340 domain-containing protein [Lachnospiraceae bacterium]
MTDKQKKSFVVMFFIMLAVVGAYLVINLIVENKKANEEAQETKGVIIEVYQSDNIDDIVSISYLADEQQVKLVKNKEGEWNAEGSDLEITSKIITEEMLPQLRYVVADDVIDDIESLDEFGFDAPINMIDIAYKNGEEHKFVIGTKNTFNNAYYMIMDDNKEKIYVIDSVLQETFSKKLEELQIVPGEEENN